MCADGFQVSESDVELFLAGIKNDRPPRSILANVFKDEALRRIQTPTLLVIGEQEVIYKPRRAVERATRLIPNVQAQIIPHAGHGSVIEKPQEASRVLLAFLEK